MIKNFLKSTIVCILVFESTLVFSQSIEVKGGFGNYEGFNIGLNHTFDEWRLEYGIGNDLNIYSQGYYSALHVAVGKSVFKRIMPTNNPVYVGLKAVVWNLENQSNVFSAISFSGELSHKLRLSRSLQLGIYGGIVWSRVFRYRHKGYQEVGFTRDWQPNFGLAMYKKLK